MPRGRLLLRGGNGAQHQNEDDGGSDRSGNSNHRDLREVAILSKSGCRRDTAKE